MRAYDVHVARLGFDLNINVKAGENSGRKLLHDFVVLSLADAPLNAGGADCIWPPVRLRLLGHAKRSRPGLRNAASSSRSRRSVAGDNANAG